MSLQKEMPSSKKLNVLYLRENIFYTCLCHHLKFNAASEMVSLQTTHLKNYFHAIEIYTDTNWELNVFFNARIPLGIEENRSICHFMDKNLMYWRHWGGDNQMKKTSWVEIKTGRFLTNYHHRQNRLGWNSFNLLLIKMELNSEKQRQKKLKQHLPFTPCFFPGSPSPLCSWCVGKPALVWAAGQSLLWCLQHLLPLLLLSPWCCRAVYLIFFLQFSLVVFYPFLNPFSQRLHHFG